MNQETPNGAPRRAPIRTAKSPGSGNWAKWAAGAAVAAVLVGGGYYALTSMGPAEAPVETAYNSQDQDFDRAGPADPFADIAPADEAPDAEAAAADAAPAPAPRPRRQAAAQPAPEAVPEEVIGVSSAEMAAVEDEGFVVQGSRRPQWARTPTARRLNAAYPEWALERGREGEARLRCTVEDGGALDCTRASETPANAGFGLAALRVARMYRHAPERYDGSSAIGTPVNLRVVFRLDESRARS